MLHQYIAQDTEALVWRNWFHIGLLSNLRYLLRIERGKRQPYAKRWMTNDDTDGTSGIYATVPRHDKELSGGKDMEIYFNSMVYFAPWSDR